MKNIEKLKEELNYWKNEFKPVNNMGKWGKQVRVDSINKALEAAEAEQYDKERDILKLCIEFMDDVTKHDYSYEYSDSHNNYMNGSGSEKNIKEKLHILIGICRYDAIQLLDDVLSAVPEQFKDGLTHKVIRGWFTPYVEDEGPEVDGAGFTDDDRIVNGQYKTNK